MYLGSGLLIIDRLVLRCGHSFDPVHWGGDIVRYRKIFICDCDPACESHFPLMNSNDSVIECRIIRRGLEADNLSDNDEISGSTTDLALLTLVKPIPNVSKNDYFDPKINLSSCTPNDLPVNSKLFLIGYNDALYDDDDLDAYKHVKGFENLTIDRLNSYHNVNYPGRSFRPSERRLKRPETAVYCLNFHPISP
jgi:hypothetical protein